jgi:hypothetical protein
MKQIPNNVARNAQDRIGWEGQHDSDMHGRGSMNSRIGAGAVWCLHIAQERRVPERQGFSILYSIGFESTRYLPF